MTSCGTITAWNIANYKCHVDIVAGAIVIYFVVLTLVLIAYTSRIPLVIRCEGVS